VASKALPEAGTGKNGQERTLQEGNHGNQAFVSGCTGPFGNDDGVLGMRAYMFRMRIKEDDFREIAVEVREILQGRSFNDNA
jgi:hypothetical protein